MSGEEDGEGGTAEGGEEGVTVAGGFRTGLGVRNSPPLVAQPVSPVQQMPNANQKVADLLERRMLKNLQGSRQFRYDVETASSYVFCLFSA